MNTILITTVALGIILPFALRDGKKYKVILMAVLLLLPFYQGFIYFRYMIILFILLILWKGDDGQLLRYAKEPINRCMMLFFVFSLLSAVMSADITSAITPVSDLIFFYLLFLICSVGIKRQLTTTLVPTILLWCLLSSVFIQTMQLYGVQAFYIYAEDRLNMNTGIGYDNSDRVVRYWGPFGNALTFSSYLAVFGMFLFAYYHSNLQKNTRRLSYIVLAVSTYGVLLTSGRTAMISVVIGLLFYAFTKNGKRAITLLLCTVLAFVLFSTILDQFLSGTSLGMYQRFTTIGTDNSYRTETWIRALPVLLANPLFGTGPGNLQAQIAPLIRAIFINDKTAVSLPWGHVENTYLSVLYTFGFTGFACFLYMITKSFLYGFRTIKQNVPPPVRQSGYALATAWVVIAVNMIANPVFVTDYRLISLMLFFVAYAVQVGWKPGRFGTKMEIPVVDLASFQRPPAPGLPQPTQLA